jgi:hypothetical protein
MLAAVVAGILVLDLGGATSAWLIRRDEPRRPLPSFRLGAHPVAGIPSDLIPLPSELPTIELTRTFSPAFGVDPRSLPERHALLAVAAARRYAANRSAADLTTARRHVQLAMRGAHRALVPHRAPGRDLVDVRMPSPWYSADVQGLLLVAVSDIATTTGRHSFRRKAGRLFRGLLTFRSFARFGRPSPALPWISSVDEYRYLWFEEFPRPDDTSPSLTTHLTTLFGVYRYWSLTHSTRAEKVFRGGVATVRQYLVEARRPGAIAVNGVHGGVRDIVAHTLLERQLRVLQEMTGTPVFGRWSRLLREDLANPRVPEWFHTTEVTLRQDIDVYARASWASSFPTTMPPEADRRADPNLAARYGIRALERYANAGSPADLQAAEVVARGLLDDSVGAMFLHYRAAPGGFTQFVPWASAETQGLVLSLLSRLAKVSGSPAWRSAADRTFLTFLRFRGESPRERAGTVDPWTSVVDDNGYVWFERYAQSFAALYLESQLNATFGLYDYWLLRRSQAAERLIQGSVATISGNLDSIRVPGQVSRLGVADPRQDRDEHGRVVAMMGVLAQATGDPGLAEGSRLLDSDA